MNHVLIVGAGQAGARAALALRDLGWTGGITLAGDEDLAPYERPPLSKEVLLGTASGSEALIATPSDLAARAISLRTGTGIASLDVKARTARCFSGETIEFSHLILATGARARRLAVPGADELAGIYYLRNAADAQALRAALSTATRVAIIGGGFIGLEVAAAARQMGVGAVVLERENACLNRVMPPASVAPLLTLHRSHEVKILCDAAVASLEGDLRVERVRLADGRTIPADVVVVGIGSIANDEIAREAGIECMNGIVVDDDCRSSIPFVYAIGDVASRRNASGPAATRLESWENAERQAVVAAAAITGADRPEFPAPWFWTDQYDVNVQMIGTPSATDDVVIRRMGGNQLIHFYFKGDLLSGAVLFNSGKEKRAITRLVGSRVDREQLADQANSLKQISATTA